MTIEFDEATHTYTFAGKRVPSVTQILQDSKICDYSEMSPQFRRFALKRGSFVHKATEMIDDGTLDYSSVDKALVGYVNAYMEFRKRYPWLIVAQETIIHNARVGYAGKIDRLFLRDNGKSSILIDIKTGSAAPKWVGLQLAAYIGGLPASLHPERVSAAALCLHGDGSYALTEEMNRSSINAAFKVFKAAMVVAKYNGRKAESK